MPFLNLGLHWRKTDVKQKLTRSIARIATAVDPH